MTGFDVVTGAFSYSGAAIAKELQAAGRRVRTLTGHPGRAPETGTASGIEVRPLDFTDPAALAESMRGAGTLYNTYWLRFAHGTVDHPVAVARSRVLFQAAAEAGVRRIVHVSITNPSSDSPYPYFRGKAAVEEALGGLGVSHAVLRLAAAPPAGVRRRRHRCVPAASDSHRRPGPAGRTGGEVGRH
jgi:NADH dehydrogenase